MEHNCQFCGKKLELSALVVSSEDNQLFCAPEIAPLEPGSCALKYIERNPEYIGKTYFFIKLGEEE